MPDKSPPGILAIWNDIDDAVAADYEHWYQRQHLYERVAIPGFRYGRRYIAHGHSPRFFSFYETDTPAVLTGGEYLERLNDPTPWTQSLMPRFLNFSRTVCRQVIAAGDQSGGWAATATLVEPLPETALETLRRELGRLESWPAIARVRVWQSHDPGAAAATEEAALPPGADGAIGAALIVEATSGDAAADCLADLLAAGGRAEAAGATGVYQIICHIDGDEIRRGHGG